MRDLNVQYSSFSVMFGQAPVYYQLRNDGTYNLFGITNSLFVRCSVRDSADISDFESNHLSSSTQVGGYDDAMLLGSLFLRTGSSSHTVVPATTTATTILAANASRKGATILNRSNKDLYLMVASTPTPTSSVHAVVVNSGGYYEVPFGYAGLIRGIWAASSPSNDAQVVEFT